MHNPQQRRAHHARRPRSSARTRSRFDRLDFAAFAHRRIEADSRRSRTRPRSATSSSPDPDDDGEDGSRPPRADAHRHGRRRRAASSTCSPRTSRASTSATSTRTTQQWLETLGHDAGHRAAWTAPARDPHHAHAQARPRGRRRHVHDEVHDPDAATPQLRDPAMSARRRKKRLGAGEGGSAKKRGIALIMVLGASRSSR